MISKRRLTVLEKLISYGADTEKKISALTTEDIYNVITSQGLKVSDIKEILDLQKAIKERKIIPYFTGGKDKEIKGNDTNNNTRTGDTGNDQKTDPRHSGWNGSQHHFRRGE
jgi:hypothetical protein